MQWTDVLGIFAVLSVVAGVIAVAATLYRRRNVEALQKALMEEIHKNEAQSQEVLNNIATLETRLTEILSSFPSTKPKIRDDLLKLQMMAKQGETGLANLKELLRDVKGIEDWSGYNDYREHMTRHAQIYENLQTQTQSILERLDQISSPPSAKP